MPKRDIPLEWIPTLPRRYAATTIDGLLMIGAIVLPSALWPTDDTLVRTARIAFALVAVLVYEPLCTGRFVTLGQAITRVRVRRFENGERLGILRAFVRIILKVVLGVLSFLVLPFTPGRRAIHDMATDSIVIMAAAERDYAQWAASRRDAPDAAGPATDSGPLRDAP